MKKNGLILLFVLVGFQLMAQFSINAGTSLFNNFGIGTNFYGFDFGAEYSDSDDQSYWGRISIYPGKNNMNVDSVYLTNVDPNQNFKNLGYTIRTSYTQISGGSRYYIGDGYEYGFAAFGGYKFSVIVGTAKFEYDEYDKQKYILPDNAPFRSQILFLGIGLNGGVKYSFGTAGTVYLDFSADYGLINSRSNDGILYSDYLRTNVFFGINLGYRKDLNWY